MIKMRDRILLNYIQEVVEQDDCVALSAEELYCVRQIVLNQNSPCQSSV